MCGHRVQFYDTEAFLLRKVSEFIDAGLQQQGVVIVIATGPHVERLKARFAQHEASARPQDVVWLDAHETLARFMVDGVPDAKRFRDVVGRLIEQMSDHGRRRVTAFGEMVAELYLQGKGEAAVRLEQLWQALGRRLSFDLLCAYPMSAFPDVSHRGAFHAICEVHSQVAPLERFEDAAADPGQLHRLLARLQQSANALDHEVVRRRRTDRLLGEQTARITAMECTHAALRSLAGQDALTGLCNRRAFGDCLAHAFARARRTGTQVALLFVDLDDFKIFNDRFGHQAGDRLLREAGARLVSCVRQCDTVARIGGDEFTIVMEDADAREAALLAQRVVDALAQKFRLGSEEVKLTASIGLGLYPDDASDAQGLIRRADEAMYRAKALGKGRFADPRRTLREARAREDGETVQQTTAAGAAAANTAANMTAAAADPAVPAAEGTGTAWVTVARAALQLGLSRPHVAKLIAEHRFHNVVRQDGSLPLIPASEVTRVAKELYCAAERPSALA